MTDKKPAVTQASTKTRVKTVNAKSVKVKSTKRKSTKVKSDAEVKKTSASKSKSKSKSSTSSKHSWQRWALVTLLKLSIAVIFAVGLYVIYLDGKVRATFEGQRWQIPVQVFGQIEKIKIGDMVSLTAIAQSLSINGYQKVSQVAKAGQYAQSAHRIIIFRRAFDFGDGLTRSQQLTIDIGELSANDSLSVVIQLYREQVSVEQIKLEPILIDRIIPDDKEDRLLVSLENIPESLLDTLIFIEDRNFYHHKGVSPFSILRALYANIRAGHTVQGGSTLTQQLAKNMYLTRERTLSRKIKEALMALILDYRYSKDQLLEAYINEVYLGQHYANGIYGFGLAAKFYFGRDISQLSAEQIAVLVSQIKGPSYYDPWRFPKRAKSRRDLVLKLMLEQNIIAVDEFERAIEMPLSIRENRRLRKQKYPAYLQLVKAELSKQLTFEQQQTGIRVFTGFSHHSQQLIEQSIGTQLPLLEKKLSTKYRHSSLEVAMLVTDIHSGEIRAIAGGRQSGYAGFNRALYAKRAIGSLIKPAIYLAALERYEQYNFASLLEDKAIVLANGNGNEWRPKNYDNKYRGQVPLIDGLVKSLNIPTVNLGMDLGLKNVAQAINLLGYEDELTLRPSILLGAINMSPMEINQLYQPIANKGAFIPTHAINKIIAASGESLWQFAQIAEPVLSENGAYLIDYALAQVTKNGTAKSLTWRLKNKHLAGKTGTSNDLRDSWFIGYDKQHLVTTWLGKDNNQTTGLTGSSGALVLFADYMKHQGIVDKTRIQPDGISPVLFEKTTGNAVTPQCADTINYPAVTAVIVVNKTCVKINRKQKSWFDKIFGP